ncbi:hypothetical protein Tcan_13238 [Toxocara canis]|uniref:Uncharacterized protein n=1 Tax=Toxocara canis TaxID=6265 RepID=A0A0B2VWM5_TOXCA|nr:hypothetical protein Tcan_13238 [Toxocara canis]
MTHSFAVLRLCPSSSIATAQKNKELLSRVLAGWVQLAVAVSHEMKMVRRRTAGLANMFVEAIPKML